MLEEIHNISSSLSKLTFSNESILYLQKLKISTKNGWLEILINCFQKLENINCRIKILQIEEKFGMLKILYSTGKLKNLERLEKIANTIKVTEQLSLKICEFCGSKENVYCGGKPWAKTLCRKCHQIRDNADECKNTK